MFDTNTSKQLNQGKQSKASEYDNFSMFQVFILKRKKRCCHHSLTNDLFKDTKINFPGNNYLFKVNNRNTRKSCKTCSKLTIKTLERRQWLRSYVLIVNLEHISKLFSVLLLLTLIRIVDLFTGFQNVSSYKISRFELKVLALSWILYSISCMLRLKTKENTKIYDANPLGPSVGIFFVFNPSKL